MATVSSPWGEPSARATAKSMLSLMMCGAPWQVLATTITVARAHPIRPLSDLEAVPVMNAAAHGALADLGCEKRRRPASAGRLART